MDDETPISYLALQEGAAVLTSSGAPIGTVARVLQIPSEDLFDGIVVTTGQGERFVDASQIDTITTTAVHCSVSDADAEDLPLPLGATSGGTPPEAPKPSWSERIGRMFGRQS